MDCTDPFTGGDLMQTIDRAAEHGYYRVTAKCPNCTSTGMRVFYTLSGVPVHSCLLMSTAEEALAYPKGEIELAYCSVCGFISNLAFDPKRLDYSASYEETQGFSPHFN